MEFRSKSKIKNDSVVKLAGKYFQKKLKRAKSASRSLMFESSSSMKNLKKLANRSRSKIEKIKKKPTRRSSVHSKISKIKQKLSSPTHSHKHKLLLESQNTLKLSQNRQSIPKIPKTSKPKFR